MEAAKHSDEAKRIAALRAFNILDTPREKDFDDIVEIVARACGAPIAVVNLIDESRQWFKAEVGLGVRETPLDTSICAHAILQEDFFLIEDTLDDPRFADNPLCAREPNLRFYAGALLKSAEGFPIGTLCVLDTEPRTLDAEQIRLIEVMARQVMTQLDLRKSVRTHATFASEASHRTKNLLSVVIAIAHQIKRRTDTVDGFMKNLESRLVHLGRTQELLSTRDWTSADLRELAASITGEFHGGAGRITVSGPSVVVDGQAAENIAFALFELATNAVKYGALSQQCGGVDIAISRRSDGAALEWRERGGPAVTPPTDEGIGTLIIRKICPAAVGQGELRFDPDGVVWALEIDAKHLIA